MEPSTTRTRSKVLIGPDNLTANGIDIPTWPAPWSAARPRATGRSRACAGKSARSRSCSRTAPSARCRRTATRAAAAAATRVTTAPASKARPGLDQRPYGIPCVSGERRSNAQQYLGSQALITAAGAGAASLIKSDNGSVAVVANNNGSLGTVGISGNEAMGRILAGGVRDMADWVNKLYGQAFAAVVQPGAKVAVHLEQPLDIDYDAKGRRVHHRTGEAHASDLD